MSAKERGFLSRKTTVTLQKHHEDSGIGSGHPSPSPPPVPPKTNDKWLEIIGIPSRILMYAAIFGLLILFAPKDITNIALGQLTLGDLIMAALWLAAGAALIRFLFKPSSAPEVRKAWGALGIILVAGIAIAAIYLSRH
jgi:hypothetical protein